MQGARGMPSSGMPPPTDPQRYETKQQDHKPVAQYECRVVFIPRNKSYHSSQEETRAQSENRRAIRDPVMSFLRVSKQDDEHKCADCKKTSEADGEVVALAIGAVVEIHRSDRAEQSGNHGEGEGCEKRQHGRDRPRKGAILFDRFSQHAHSIRLTSRRWRWWSRVPQGFLRCG